MAMECKTCFRPDRDFIDFLIVSGMAKRRIATQYGLSEASIRRHAENHLPEKLLKAKNAQDITDANKLVEHMQYLWTDDLRLKDKLEKVCDYKGALAANRDLMRLLELRYKIHLGETDWIPHVQVLEFVVWVNRIAVKYIRDEDKKAYSADMLSTLPRAAEMLKKRTSR
jgi:hypothetical protein